MLFTVSWLNNSQFNHGLKDIQQSAANIQVTCRAGVVTTQQPKTITVQAVRYYPIIMGLPGIAGLFSIGT
jgi:hypothetical protein